MKRSRTVYYSRRIGAWTDRRHGDLERGAKHIVCGDTGAKVFPRASRTAAAGQVPRAKLTVADQPFPGARAFYLDIEENTGGARLERRSGDIQNYGLYADLAAWLWETVHLWEYNTVGRQWHTANGVRVVQAKWQGWVWVSMERVS